MIAAQLSVAAELDLSPDAPLYSKFTALAINTAILDTVWE